MIQDQPATFLPAREAAEGGSGEVGRTAHWTQMLECSDGRYVHGYGLTKEEAEREADSKRKTAEYEIAQPAKGQIRIILERCKDGKIYDADQQRLLRLLSKVVLGEG